VIVIVGVVVIAALSWLFHSWHHSGRGLCMQLGAALAKPPWLMGHTLAARVCICVVSVVLEVVGLELH